METLLILNYSKDDLEEIARQVRENDSFVALVTGDIYAIHEYLLPSSFGNFTAMLDRNVYTRVTALVRGQAIPDHAVDDYRWAAAVMAFCQIAEITFQYGSSLQEYASTKGGSSAVDDFECFHRADNCDPQAMVDFAVGRTSSLNLSSVADLAPPEEVPTAERFEEPIYEFRSHYIFALKIALLDAESSSPEQKMYRFMDWMEDEFILSAGALQFANLLFSPARRKGMLKKRTLQDIRNVGWDLSLIHSWRRNALKGAEISEPVLLVTRDKVVKLIANRLVASDDEEFRSHFVDQWEPVRAKGDAIFKRSVALNETVQSQWGRRKLPTDDELDTMTADFERQLITNQQT